MPLKRRKFVDEETCDRCGGLGRLGVLSNVIADSNATMECPRCKGSGWLEINRGIESLESNPILTAFIEKEPQP